LDVLPLSGNLKILNSLEAGFWEVK